MARDPVQSILEFNSGFDPQSLKRKLEAISSSPFALFRATFHLFAADLLTGPFRKLPVSASKGPIVADLHTENFGVFRGISGELVYDINDFDDTAAGHPYEYDLRRLLTAVLLGGTESGLKLGEAAVAAETAARSYFQTIARFAAIKKRAGFAALHDPAAVRRLLQTAAEKPRDAFLKSIAEAGPRGRFEFKPGNPSFRPVDGRIRAEADKRFAFFLKHCTAPPKAGLGDYVLEDVVFRYAGKGSLGKNRYALLVAKNSKPDFKSLRVIEWKDSTDSPLDSPRDPNRRRQSKARNKQVYAAELAFQFTPKRYLGYTTMFGKPMQGREIGANDCRFGHSQYASVEGLNRACVVFGEVTARAHLLASLGTEGPRKMVARSGVTEDRLVHRLLAFAMSYSSRVHEDFDEVKKRRGEFVKAWKA